MNSVNISEILRSEKFMIDLTGVSLIEFYRLVSMLEKSGIFEEKHKDLPTLELKAFFILLYWKFRPTEVLMSILFRMSQEEVVYWIHKLTAFIQDTSIFNEAKIPTTSMEELLKVSPEVAELFDIQHFLQHPEILDCIVDRVLQLLKSRE